MPRRDCACADHSRPSLSTALLSGWSSHLVNRVSPHNPLVPSTLARARRAYPSQAQLGYTGAGRSAPHLVLIMFQLAFPLSQARTPWTRQARLRSPKACVRGHDRSLPHLFLIGFRPATRLMISSCRVVTALALITRAPLIYRLVERLVFTPYFSIFFINNNNCSQISSMFELSESLRYVISSIAFGGRFLIERLCLPSSISSTEMLRALQMSTSFSILMF